MTIITETYKRFLNHTCICTRHNWMCCLPHRYWQAPQYDLHASPKHVHALQLYVAAATWILAPCTVRSARLAKACARAAPRLAKGPHSQPLSHCDGRGERIFPSPIAMAAEVIFPSPSAAGADFSLARRNGSGGDLPLALRSGRGVAPQRQGEGLRTYAVAPSTIAISSSVSPYSSYTSASICLSAPSIWR